jgi:prepilin-type N-terminal cleavage/methylation domain-containing protein
MRFQQLRGRSGSQGFSLLELLLVTVLVLLLVGAMVFNFSTLLRGNQLEEGTTRLETLMRFAGARFS